MRRPAEVAALGALAFLLLSQTGARGEVVQRGGVRLALSGAFSPRTLPRRAAAPIAVELGGRISSAAGGAPPALREVEIAVNRAARFDPAGLPTCTYAELQPSTTAGALAACAAAKIGEGSFAADVQIPEQSPFPAKGRLLAFNGREEGRPVIFAHVYGAEPIPTSYTLTLRLARGHGRWGTVLRGALPGVAAKIAFVTAIELRLGGPGAARSYLSAACAAPAGLSTVSFPLARAGFGFQGGLTLTETLTRSCRARGR